VTFSNDDRVMVVANGTGELLVANLQTHHTVSAGGWPKQCPLNLDGPPAISNDDRLVAAYSLCGRVAVGSTRTAKPFEGFEDDGPVQSAAFNPVNDELAVGSQDGSVSVLDLTTDTRVQELLGHSRFVDQVAFGPRARYIAAGSLDNTIRVWDAASGQTLQVDHDFTDPYYGPFISPDGRFLIEMNRAGQTIVWPACPDCEDPSALLQASKAGVVTPLTPIEQAQVAAAG
jgi:WD40 repeat protein